MPGNDEQTCKHQIGRSNVNCKSLIITKSPYKNIFSKKKVATHDATSSHLLVPKP